MIRYLDNKENITIKAGIILCMLLWCVSGIMCALSVEDEYVEDRYVEEEYVDEDIGLCIVILIFLSAMCFVGISALMEDYSNDDLQKDSA